MDPASGGAGFVRDDGSLCTRVGLDALTCWEGRISVDSRVAGVDDFLFRHERYICKSSIAKCHPDPLSRRVTGAIFAVILNLWFIHEKKVCQK